MTFFYFLFGLLLLPMRLFRLLPLLLYLCQAHSHIFFHSHMVSAAQHIVK